jgi:hypothetical protein
MNSAGWRSTPEESSTALFFASRAARTLSRLIERLPAEPDLRRRLGTETILGWDRNRSAALRELLKNARKQSPSRGQGAIFAAGLFFALASTALRVDSSVKRSVSFGILVTNGPTNQPRPVGISRVSEATSLCT